MTAIQAAGLLNEMLALDPGATRRLVEGRVPANEALASHEDVRVLDDGGAYRVGLLGVLNGLLRRSGDTDAVAAVYDRESGRILRFDVVEVNG